MSTSHWQKKMEIPGRVSFIDGNGELPKIEINAAASTAEIYLDGAQVTHFQKKNEPPILFLSQFSRWQSGQPIRGGVPIIFPWFGPREGEVMHGFARIKTWELKEIIPLPDGDVSLRFCLPDTAEASLLPKCNVEYVVTVGSILELKLTVANATSDHDLTFDNCLHTYFQVGDINAVSITGLKGSAYLDKTESFARKTESAEHVKINRETDRIYLDSPGPIEIHDSKLQRRIRIEKTGSLSTVVWNPWVAKSQQMPDFGNDEYLQMICVESGNVADNRLTLPAGKSASLKVTIRSDPL
jgi:glucose-6-phosphate 1-epimerase